MKEKAKGYGFPGAVFLLTLLDALFWVALRVNYSGISKFLGADTNPSFLVMNLPIMVCVLAWLGVALAVAGIFFPKRRWLTVSGLTIGVITTVAAVIVVLFGAKDYLYFIMPHFWESLAVAAAIGMFAGALFLPVKNTRKTVPVKAAAVLIAIVVCVVLGYQLRPCGFTYGAVVYAVEDDYQIVFSTSDSAVAWVEIDGECYYDLYAGSMRSIDKVHKITVPQAVLDEAKAYTVCAQQMIYRGPFGGYKGDTVSREYVFRPVNAADGLNHVALSDVHEAADAAIRAASVPENTDFIMLLGDIVSMVETEKDAQLANQIAHGITHGEIPVIYARGNHEIKGEYAEDFYKYVGSKNQSFYYWVTLGDSIFAVVLDMGEDHEDDWWEYYGTAQFDIYREEQTRMLQQILEEGSYRSYPYRMALCHIPITYVEEGELFGRFCNAWTELLNQMEIQISMSGHLHKMWQMLPGAVESHTALVHAEEYAGESGKTPGGYLTEHQFPAFLVGRRSLELAGSTQTNGYDQYLCFATEADLQEQRQVSRYVNSNGQTLSGYYPFEGSYPERMFTTMETTW